MSETFTHALQSSNNTIPIRFNVDLPSFYDIKNSCLLQESFSRIGSTDCMKTYFAYFQDSMVVMKATPRHRYATVRMMKLSVQPSWKCPAN